MQLERAARSGNGTLKWFPSTVIKDLEIDDNIIESAIDLNLSSPTESGDAYCTQGFTYPLAMEQTATAQPQQMPSFYRQYEPYYGYDREPQLETLRRRLQRNGNPIDFPALSAPFSRPYQPYPRQNGWQELR